MKAAEIRELNVDELRAREQDLDDQLFRLRIQKSMGQLEAPRKCATCAGISPGSRRSCARRQAERRDTMSIKAQLTGTVVSDKMDKTVVVAVERQVRHAVYGKTQRKTSRFVAHNEKNEARTATRWRSPSRVP
jgi:hypothetical protein